MVVKDKNLQIAAAELLGLALLDVFPKAKILESYLTPIGFGLDFVADHVIDETAFNLIDERMRILSKKDLSFEKVDMMRENAASLFKHKGQNFLAERIAKDPRNIIPLTRIDAYYGYNLVENAPTSKNLGEGKLLTFSSYEDFSRKQGSPITISLEGVLCEDSKEARQFLKRYKEGKKNDHQILGPQLELFVEAERAVPGDFIWLPRGESIKESFISFWKREYKGRKYQFFSAPKWVEFPKSKQKNMARGVSAQLGPKEISYLSDSFQWLKKIGKLQGNHLPLKVAEIHKGFNISNIRKKWGLHTSDIFTSDSAYCVCEEGEASQELISSLQFLVKSINMFAIEIRWSLILNVSQAVGFQRFKDDGVELLVNALQSANLKYTIESEEKNDRIPRIQARFIDSLEREWDGASLSLAFFEGNENEEGQRRNKQRLVLIKESLFGSLERCIALLVEKHGGQLPLCIEKTLGKLE